MLIHNWKQTIVEVVFSRCLRFQKLQQWMYNLIKLAFVTV